MANNQESGMTSRERWTVYPLLFLTLGLVMRDRMEDEDRQLSGNSVAAQELVTKQLRIVGNDGLSRIILTPDEIIAPKLTTDEVVTANFVANQAELQTLKVVNEKQQMRIVLTARGWQLADPSKMKRTFAPD